MLSVLVCLSIQGPHLEVSPSLPRAGEGVRVQAVDAAGEVGAGVTLELRDDADVAVMRVTTSADGVGELVVAHAGVYTLRWQAEPDLVVLVPIHVAPPQSRTLLALWTVPLGLVLGWAALRRAGRDRATVAPAHSSVSPGPSRSAAEPSADLHCR
ncbi:MAG: hypothetical protein R3F56_11070 [Planctomycetota bacterium]